MTALVAAVAQPAAADDHGYQWPRGEVAHGRGSVTWSSPGRPGVSFEHSTRWWGAASTRFTITGPRSPHVYRFRVRLPHDSRLVLNRHGEVVAWQHGRRLGVFGRPWAANSHGKRIKTWYSVRGHVISQHVPFRRHAAFPITADPWWNPFSWAWGDAFSVLWSEVRRCGTAAVKTIQMLAVPTVLTNIALIHVAGRAAVMVPGGPYAYAALGVYGCLGSYF